MPEKIGVAEHGWQPAGDSLLYFLIKLIVKVY